MVQSTKFLEGIGEKLAEKWVATLFTPAFLFWAGGLLAGIHKFGGWNLLQSRIGALSDPQQIAILTASLLLLTTSAFAIQRFDLKVLRLLEGYWPFWLQPLCRWLKHRQHKKYVATDEKLQELMSDSEYQTLTPSQDEKLLKLDLYIRYTPSQHEQTMPTRLGNILRSAERRPQARYGLDAVICWPHLWLLLPDNAKAALQEARSNLNAAARVWLWSILFMVWFVVWPFYAWWAVPISLFSASFAYGWALEAAFSYSHLLEATFDLHRFSLYHSLRWPLPADSVQELEMGQRLTEYLWRGPVRGPITFYEPQNEQ